MTISKRLRFEVLKRDKHTCRYCRSTEGALTIDHVIPVSLGGSDAPDNLVAACADCNSGKSSSSATDELIDDVDEAAQQWSVAIKQAADVLARQRSVVNEYISTFEAEWGSAYKLPSDYEQSLESLHHAGLPIDLMKDAIYITFTAVGVKSRFRYFCGVSWRRVSELQEIAMGLLAEKKGALNDDEKANT